MHSDIEKLLSNVSVSVKKINAQQKSNGELFNIFSIAKIERAEVNTHSSMIAELLNPSGSHGQGDKFLILFLRIFSSDEPFAGTLTAKVFKEKSFTRGRDRVDILIDLKDHVFLIENKIDAIDGNKQLKRYAEVGDSYQKGKQPHLIYLTKYGSDAEEYSHQGVEYQCISYKEDILVWLNLCIEEVSSISAIKYALLQYQYLIQKITGTTMTNVLTNEIVNLLMTENNLKYADVISKAILPAKGKILFNFFQKLEQSLSKPNSVSVIKGNFKELEYNEKKCIDWFKIRKKSHNIGIFFDICIPNFLFRVEVASQALHYGLVSVEKDSAGKYKIIDLQDLQIKTSQNFEYRKWKRIKWFSVMYKDFVSRELDCIKDDKEFVEDVVRSISELKLAILNDRQTL